MAICCYNDKLKVNMKENVKGILAGFLFVWEKAEVIFRGCEAADWFLGDNSFSSRRVRILAFLGFYRSKYGLHHDWPRQRVQSAQGFVRLHRFLPFWHSKGYLCLTHGRFWINKNFTGKWWLFGAGTSAWFIPGRTRRHGGINWCRTTRNTDRSNLGQLPVPA